ncbi:MAG: hypothetical protein MUC29_04180 [Pyrinomonadaceae bacterium]|jgi:photosystem II stability/assembly factor-like uncharacterized protein|nr:hypothetical protein [Pyrinomonadaceae bacterium]
MKLRLFVVFFCLSIISTSFAFQQTPVVSSTATATPAPTPIPIPDALPSAMFSGLRFRSIGPAVTSGRVLAFAMDPNDRAKYYVAVASGGVWKTVNSGTTWTSVFDNEGAFSIGAIAIDQKNPSTVWVGTGERNSQRSAGYGDGVYKSEDGGKSWKNMGLKTSEHIGRIAIDPRDSNVVFVAAQGPLWSAGGERGLYKTTDGGKTWKAVITISEHTGVNEVHIDPSNPDIMYASSWQRRRHFYTLINGGPESAIYKSTDGGNTWAKTRSGLPPGDLGRIGLDISPANTNVVYATVEASGNLSGIFRSNDRGATWERTSSSIAQGMYWGQIIADPKDVDRIYIPSVIFQVSDDAGRTQRPLGQRLKHVDSHAIWIDPKNTDYYLAGTDGGVYESFDRGTNWHFKANLPVAQFYDVAVDNATPFYNVYGGTQDNNSMGGPAKNRNTAGIINADWFITNGGDGFKSAIDPLDPNIIYAESQEGGLVRFDKRTGERVGIAPIEGKDIESQRYNWDSPFIISPHSNTRLYFAGHKLFKTDNRGDDWKVISGDLSRGLDRNALPVMGKIWGPDAVGKNQSTALYGNASAVSESPKKAGLIYIGTDDGLIQITENDGGSWRKVDKIEGVPSDSYVTRIFASQHDVNTVYATFNNHQNGDFKPYIVKSTDIGKTWKLINGNLPERGSLYAFNEDHINPNLLFVGTEFGFFFSVDGGGKWIQLKSGLPTIAVRDIAIQRTENDLVLGTFGRGIYVLDDYSALRQVSENAIKQNASLLFPVKDALMYVRSNAVFSGFQGASFYTAPNPAYGATFVYYLKEAPKTLKQKRQEAEREAEKKKQTAKYPSIEELRAEAEEEPPSLIFTITDSEGKIVRRFSTSAMPGVNRAVWDMRYLPPNILANPIPPTPEMEAFGFNPNPQGYLVMPGKYSVSMALKSNGVVTDLKQTQSFNVVTEGREKMSSAEIAELSAFQKKVGALQRAVSGSIEVGNATRAKVLTLKRSANDAPVADTKPLVAQADAYLKEINLLLNELRGGRENSDIPPPSINSRVGYIASTIRLSSTKPTQTQIEQYELSNSEFKPVLARLKKLVEVDLPAFEKQLEAVNAPLTPGRLPQFEE